MTIIIKLHLINQEGTIYACFFEEIGVLVIEPEGCQCQLAVASAVY